ncbi:MAG: hypothetical protein VX938_00795, partial [Myxococcota bacterium]|nr:hypothetical protein [Myxococcota bacterium]
MIQVGLDAVSPLREAAERSTAEAEALLREMPWAARCVALAVMGPGRPDGLTSNSQDAELEAAYAVEIGRDDTPERALAEGLSMEEDVPILWERIILPLATAEDTSGHAMMADTLSAALCITLSGSLPTAVGDVTDIRHIPTPRAQSVFALGVGHLARARHPTAEHLFLNLLASKNTSPRLRISLIRGVGSGMLDDGFLWLARAAHRTPLERERWIDAAREASYWALTSSWPGATELVQAVWATIDSIEDGLEHLGHWTHLMGEGDTQRDTLREKLIDGWSRWPAPARAALMITYPEQVLSSPNRWIEDMSPEVILAGMECADRLGTSSLDIIARWLNHPAARVREAAGEEILKTLNAEPVSVPDEPADLVTFPTDALARTTIDRIRVALVSDEPEQVVLLAQTVTPEDAPVVCRDLLAALDVPDMSVRRASLEALAMIGGTDQIEPLLKAARRLAGLGGSILTTIRDLTQAPAEPELLDHLVELMDRRLRWGDDEAVDHFLDVVGEAGIPALIAALSTPFYPPARSGAARGLARHDVDEAVFPLRLRSLMDRSVDVRDACLSAISSMGTTEVTGREMAGYAPLTAAVDEMENAAIRARSGGSAALPGLRATMEHGTWQPRVAACGALGGIPGQA